MKRYVLGFAFNEELTQVALIRKNRPEWQAGHLNGIGGKVEEGENLYDAMCREFREETGVNLIAWEHVIRMSEDEDWAVSVWAYYGADLSELKTMTDEEVGVYNVSDILTDKEEIISNLKWLIALCLDIDTIKGKIFASVEYES